MDASEFFDRVEAHPELEGAGIEEGESGDGDAIYVTHVPSGEKFRVLLSAVLEQPWEAIESILTGKREPKVLSHMTRVVGYFSRIENWNRSKVGELRERHQGDYSLKA
ncbi:MAG: hypothetical protein ACYTGB_08275 [Planctomycetota bacterium]|jgi:hypothetical protein